MDIGYHRSTFVGFKPRTPAAAFRALCESLAPPEAFVYLALSVSPLVEEPVSLEEIDRVLARRKLDLKTRFALRNLLGRLIRDPDMEIALFAAESLNILESRATEELERLKERVAGGAADDDSYRGLARGYYELGVLSDGAIRSFYLGESLGWYGKVSRLEEADTTTLFRAYVELGRPGEAGELASRALSEIPRQPGRGLLRARARLHRQGLQAVPGVAPPARGPPGHAVPRPVRAARHLALRTRGRGRLVRGDRRGILRGRGRRDGRAMRICLILEGTYPYITGGVSAWVHDIIGSLPEYEFALLTLSPEAGQKVRYALPPNVAEHLDYVINAAPPEGRTPRPGADLMDRIEYMHTHRETRTFCPASGESVRSANSYSGSEPMMSWTRRSAPPVMYG